MQHQENTQQQNEEGEYGNQQPHADHHSRRHAQKVARPAFVAGTSFDLVAVERKVFMDPVVRSVPHLQNDPRRIGRRFIGEPTVRPADELLRNEDRIQAVGKSHDTPLEISELPPSRKIQIEGNTPHEIFAHLRQSARRSESEIIKIQIIARQNDRHELAPLLETPLVAPDIEEMVGYALEKQVGPHADPRQRNPAHHAVTCRRKLAQRLREGLLRKFGQLRLREGGLSDAGPFDLFGKNDEIVVQERIGHLERRRHIPVKLYGRKHDRHADQIGHQKARQLQHADVLTE